MCVFPNLFLFLFCFLLRLGGGTFVVWPAVQDGGVGLEMAGRGKEEGREGRGRGREKNGRRRKSSVLILLLFFRFCFCCRWRRRICCGAGFVCSRRFRAA